MLLKVVLAVSSFANWIMPNLPIAKALMPAEPRLLYPRNEAAYQLGISVRALDYLIANSEIAVRRVGGRVLIPASALVAFADIGTPKPIVR